MATKGLTSKRLLDEKQMDGKVGLFGDVRIEVGGNLAFHEHHGETETYYILEGCGLYNDNNEREYEVKPGDVTFCEDGKGHGITTVGETPLRFMALIIKK